jgi:hypothetical protein
MGKGGQYIDQASNKQPPAGQRMDAKGPEVTAFGVLLINHGMNGL